LKVAIEVKNSKTGSEKEATNKAYLSFFTKPSYAHE